jgi:hypothetical protein
MSMSSMKRAFRASGKPAFFRPDGVDTGRVVAEYVARGLQKCAKTHKM